MSFALVNLVAHQCPHHIENVDQKLEIAKSLDGIAMALLLGFGIAGAVGVQLLSPASGYALIGGACAIIVADIIANLICSKGKDTSL